MVDLESPRGLKALDRLIALCRKRGVSVIKLGDIEFTLGPIPAKHTAKVSGKASKPPYEAPGEPEEFDSLTDDEKLFWSSGMAAPTEDKVTT